MKLATKILAVMLTAALSIGTAMAVPAGNVEFAGGGRGKVIFDGKTHAAKGAKCADCHTSPKLFEMKKGTSKATMADMGAGKACGACHDGKKAFSVKAADSCAKCHK